MINRLYEQLVKNHFDTNRQMLFFMGPRQVGKTTSCQSSAKLFKHQHYFNWDKQADRQAILKGPDEIAVQAGLQQLKDQRTLIIFDELHKYSKWKNFLKGWFDSYQHDSYTLVTGSAKLDTYRLGGDSLMGRYFAHRLHPLSLGEFCMPDMPGDKLYRQPGNASVKSLDALIRYGGFPEPLLKQDARFLRRWQRTRAQQLLREDIRDLTRIQELDQLEILAQLIIERCGQLTSYTTLAKQLNVSINTVKHWLGTLESLYYCFSIRPWYKNVARSLRKEPVYYLWDWSQIEDAGARLENLVASALLKSVHYWTDNGYGEFGLHFLRDKQKREVDFLVSRDGAPWFLVEVKASAKQALSKHLHHFHEKLDVPHAFQVAFDLPPIKRDCFKTHKPVIVPAVSFLSQLV